MESDTRLGYSIDVASVLAEGGLAARCIQFQVDRLIRERWIPRTQIEDTRQELALRFLLTLHRYDPKRSRASTYIVNAIGYCVKHLLRDLRRGKRRIGSRTRSLGSAATGPEVPRPGGPVPSGSFTRDVQVRGSGRTRQDDLEQLELRADLETAIAGLPDKTQAFCRSILDGDARTPLSRTNFLKLRDRLRDCGLHEYL